MKTLSNKPKLGFIGAGFIGQIAHLDNYAQLNTCELYALAEMRTDLREQVSRKYGIGKTFAHHDELITDPDVDAIIVVTARSHTFEVVFDCLQANKHVFSEKPMAGNAEQAEILVQLAKKKGLIYCVGYMKRLDEGVEKAKSLFDNALKTQSLGKLLQISAKCYMGDSYCKASGNIISHESRPLMIDEMLLAPDWLDDDRKPDFARYLNVHSHILNLIRFFLNATPSVEYFNYLNPLAHVAILSIDNVLINLETGEVQQRDWQESCTFVFERGQLILELPPALLRNVPARVTLIDNLQNAEKRIFQPDWSWAFKRQADYFVRLLCNQNSNNIISGEEALIDIQLAESIWKKMVN
ncbi:Gfo/Idh/MocA family protein [Pseudoalteromonas xiamenensis]|uniref:Gfo/Idh/MocA family oxidoreductase n=1 Tax=Pseudoalteromonas xiamenensis TaxID=882626 RepID=A0A975DGA3_9GAMM|nr:Gfo/Idh/MocA family oxidoreductase [Pseudoalteromonas xiamenensis]QTH71039.1 Gfo/Idh/MocA family oxidoreductase [Pseudoalteromonas xiamenensis]